MSRPFHDGIHASPRISVTTNGPAPTLNVLSIALLAGSITAIAFWRIFGTQTFPATTAGSPRAVASGIEAVTALVCGSIRVIPLGVVTQTASAEAAFQPAPATATRATTAFVAGSMRRTPSLPVAQIDPNAPTTPTAAGSGH